MKLQQGSSGLDVLGSVLTDGIDAARQITLARFGGSQPAPNTSAPSGAASQAGQPAFSGQVFGMSPLVAVGAVVALLLVWKLARK